MELERQKQVELNNQRVALKFAGTNSGGEFSNLRMGPKIQSRESNYIKKNKILLNKHASVQEVRIIPRV